MGFSDGEGQGMYSVAPPRAPGQRVNPLRRRGMPKVVPARLRALQMLRAGGGDGWGTQVLRGGGGGPLGMDYGQEANAPGEDGFQPPPPMPPPQEPVDPGFEMGAQELGTQDPRELLMKRFVTAQPQEPALTSRAALNRFLQKRRRPQAKRPMLPPRRPIGGAY